MRRLPHLAGRVIACIGRSAGLEEIARAIEPHHGAFEMERLAITEHGGMMKRHPSMMLAVEVAMTMALTFGPMLFALAGEA